MVGDMFQSVKVESERTEVIEEKSRVIACIVGTFGRARSRIDLSASYVQRGTGDALIESLLTARKRGVRIRMITDVTQANLEVMRAASRYMEVRHVAGIKGNTWAVSEGEYLSSLAADEFEPSFPVVHSNSRSLVTEHQSIFEVLWSHGEPLQERADRLAVGTDLPEIQVLRDPGRIRKLYLSLVDGAKEEILILLPTAMALRRDSEIGVVDALERASRRGVDVRLLSPVDQWVRARLPNRSSDAEGGGFDYRAIGPAGTKETVTLVIVDRTASLTMDERDSEALEFGGSVATALLATREPRVRLSIRFFERIWTESELREAEELARQREESNRKRAELMQDVLTHDIRNFNQVARLNAELLADKAEDQDSVKRIDAILRAVDGSSKLIERAKKLGGFLAAGEVDLRPMSLKASFDRSLALVRKGNPQRKVKVKSSFRGYVLADEFLDEVFVNILSNSVKYTEDKDVRIELSQEQASIEQGPHAPTRRSWKISVSDWGRGVPDSQKPGLFRRYLETAKGSGLGLSIVHALVTERYGGKANLRDRIDSDYGKGTTVELWIPRS